MRSLFPPLDPGIRLELNGLISLIDKVFPLPRRFRAALPNDVAELSRLFTSERGNRCLSYLGKPNILSAYLRYFLPWNVYRLCRLLPSLPLDLKDGDCIIDLGSGPLTFVIALWLSRPDLRSCSLEFLCLDRTALVLEAGKKVFSALAAREAAAEKGKTGENLISDGAAGKDAGCKWNIRIMKGEISGKGIRCTKNHKKVFIHSEKVFHGKPAALVCAVNVFNEIFREFSSVDRIGVKNFAEQSARLLGLYGKNGHILVAEPGIPGSGEFISRLRSSFLEQGLELVSPCIHREACPFPGGMDSWRGVHTPPFRAFKKGMYPESNTLREQHTPSLQGGVVDSKKNKAKWCHFSFDTDDAPKELLKLSAAAMIPKERAVLSFLLVRNLLSDSQNSKEKAVQKDSIYKALIISDSFPVGSYFCRYACSCIGVILVRSSREKMEALCSGTYAELKISDQRDPKSGAIIGNYFYDGSQ